jgi:predicted DNA-binding ribbon-helix-helix protein
MTASTTVRVSLETRDRLRRIAERRGLSTPAVLDELSRREEERDELLAWSEDLRAMSPDAVADYRADFAEWDGTVADGLDEA